VGAAVPQQVKNAVISICHRAHLCYSAPVVAAGDCLRHRLFTAVFPTSRGAPPQQPGPTIGARRAEHNEEEDMSDVAERVKKIVVEHLSVDEDKVTENASFIDDLGADSLDTVELVMAFEEEFGIEIPDDAAETIQTFGDAVKFISNAS